MPDFSKYSNYSAETGFTSVIFGAKAPVLEVELNEMQQIINNKFSLFLRGFGKKLIPLREEHCNITDDVITLNDCLILCNGNLIYINESHINIDTNVNSGYLYARIEKETEVDGNTTLTAYGDTEAETIENKIKDSRIPAETTRRKIVKYTLFVSETELEDTEDYSYVKLGDYSIDTETETINVNLAVESITSNSQIEKYQQLAEAVVEED